MLGRLADFMLGFMCYSMFLVIFHCWVIITYLVKFSEFTFVSRGPAAVSECLSRPFCCHILNFKKQKSISCKSCSVWGDFS